MTIRPMIIQLPPDEERVSIKYSSLDGKELERNQNWLVFQPENRIGAVDPNSSSKETTALGIDIKTSAIQQVKSLCSFLMLL